MKKIIFLCLSLVALIGSAKELNVDMYGADPQLTQQILKKYGNEVSNWSEKLRQKIVSNNDNGSERLRKMKLKLIEQIKKEGNFSHVDLQTIYYGKNDIFTTIEVVKKEDKKRLVYLEPESSEKGKFLNNNNDLIDKMISYSDMQTELFLHDQLKPIKCPVYHCVGGFNHPKLKPFLSVFNEGAVKNKAFILKTLAQDKNIERRKAAIFLMGHFKNPEEILQTLLPYVSSKSSDIRNSAMRVLVTTMQKANLHVSDVSPFVALLKSPHVTDRNKALFVLAQSLKIDKNKYKIAQCAKDQLVDLIALKQPNNHDIAYIILKEISQKDFGTNNVSAWKQWLNAHSYPVKC